MTIMLRVGLTAVLMLVTTGASGASTTTKTATSGQATAAAAVSGLTFAPVADTYVDSSAPSTVYGSSKQLVTSSSPVRRMYLKFTVSGVGSDQVVTIAKLRLHVAKTGHSGSRDGGSVATSSNTGWAESKLSYSSRPAIDGPVLGSFGRVSRDTWDEVDVTAAIRDNLTVSFGIRSGSSDSAEYDSRETGVTAPRLVITTGPAPADRVLVGAGDIATCASSGDDATAKVLDGISGTVFTAGDNAYNDGSAASFANCYHPTWGRHKARTRPSPGNHDYHTAGASGYFDYFGAAAGDRAKGYYSFSLGGWHVVAINSNCAQVGGCQAGSAQERWLRQTLAASTKPCTLAYWHHPLFTSGANHSPSTGMRPIFQALYDHNAEIVVQGHNHNYERFAPQNPSGGRDTTRGIRAFVAGTGGAGLYGFGTVRSNSEIRNNTTHGVLKLTLKANGYDWRFVPVAGKTFTDSGSGTCH